MLPKTDNHNYVYVANIKDIEAAGGCLSITVEKHPVAIFINVPPVPLPKSTMRAERSINADDSISKDPETSLKEELLSLLDRQQQVNQAAQLVVDYLYNNNNNNNNNIKPNRLLAVIGKALLREDRNFHSIQMIEAVFRQYSLLSADSNKNEDNSTAIVLLLTAATRYLAAHSPTMRSQGHTYQIANQLYHGAHLFEE